MRFLCPHVCAHVRWVKHTTIQRMSTHHCVHKAYVYTLLPIALFISYQFTHGLEHVVTLSTRQLSTTDILALATMKNAAKCDT